MSKLIIRFKELLQNSHLLGSNAEHMISRAIFDVEYDGEIYKDCSATIKQTVGSKFERNPLEVSNIVGYDGPNDFNKFSYNAEVFYRSMIGGQGSLFNVQDSNHTLLLDNVFTADRSFEYKVEGSEQAGTGW